MARLLRKIPFLKPSSRSGPYPASTRTPPKPTWRHLFAFATPRQHLPTLLPALATCLFVSGLKSFLPVAYGHFFNAFAAWGSGQITVDEAFTRIVTWCLILVAMGAATWLSNGLFMAAWIAFGEGQAKTARREVFDALLKREMAWYDVQADGIASLLTRIETQTRELQLASSQVFGFVVCDAVTSIACLALALASSYQLTLVLAASVPLSSLIFHYATKPLDPAIDAQKRSLAEASKLAAASVNAVDTVKVFGGFAVEAHKYASAVRRAAASYLVQARCNALQVGYAQLWVVALFVAGFWYGIALVEGGAAPGVVLTTFYATLAALQGFEALIPQWLVLSKGMAAGLELRQLTDVQGEEGKSGEGNDHSGERGGQKTWPPKCLGHVVAEEISFAYPSNPSRQVLSSSSFVFPAGQVTFLVGRSGSGKSTIGNLMLQFYQPTTGRIHIDGRPLSSLSPVWLRRNVTLVQQSSVLFRDTLFRNVALGHPQPDDTRHDDIVAACEAALLQSTISSLPLGGDTVVGPGGYDLSGGQRQRVALARARLRNTPILILDEVTSGLDQLSRTLIMEALREWRKDKTTIVITHDVSQIGDRDYAYVMDNGKIVQQGFKGDLLEESGSLFTSLLEPALEKATSADSKLEASEKETAPVPTPRTNSLELEKEGAARPARSRLSLRLLETMEREISISRQSSVSRGSWLVGHRQYSRSVRARRRREAEVVDSRSCTETTLTSADSEATALRPLTRSNEMVPISPVREDGLEKRLDLVTRDSEGDFTQFNFTSESEQSNSRESTFELLEAMGRSTQESRQARPELRITPPQGKGDEKTGWKWRKGMSDGSDVKADKKRKGVGSESSPDVEKFDSNTSITSILRTVWPQLGTPQRIMLILGLASCVVAAAANPAFSYSFSRLLAAFWEPTGRLAAGQPWALIMIGVGVVDGVSLFGSRYLLEYVGQAWVDGLRAEGLKRVLHQPKTWFDTSGQDAGKVIECLDRNAEEMRNIVGRFLPSIVIVSGMVGASITWALVVSWQLTLVALSSIPAYGLVIGLLSHVSGKWESRCNSAAEETSAVAREAFVNVRVVRAMTLERHFSAKHEQEAAKIFSLGVKRGAYTGICYGLQQSLNLYVTALVFWYGMWLLTNTNSVTVAGVMQVVNLLLLSIGTAVGILSSIPQISGARAAAVQMLNYASLPENSRRESGGTRMVLSPFPICFRNVSFAYPSRPGQQVLRNLSLQLECGTRVAIVGPSGCGKSTLVALLLGLYEPSVPRLSEIDGEREQINEEKEQESFNSGSLSFGGVPFSQVNIAHLRSSIAYVPQTAFLFPATIAENIAYGIPEKHPLRSLDNIAQAAQQAGIRDFIESLPEGYLTLVGDGGQTLSGGQAQRVCLARALVRNPRLLVMDEPTSALDGESAEAVRRTVTELEGVREGRMGVVVVTHCRAMMKVMDRVVCLEGGCVVGEGSYEGLLEKNARFAQLMG